MEQASRLRRDRKEGRMAGKEAQGGPGDRHRQGLDKGLSGGEQG